MLMFWLMLLGFVSCFSWHAQSQMDLEKAERP